MPLLLDGRLQLNYLIAVAFRQRFGLTINSRASARPSPMSYVRIWVHTVFSTRNREPNLTFEVRQKLFAHIRENCRAKGIFVEAIGGYSDHVHILISLGRAQDIAKVMMLIKGESAHWLNKQGFIRGKFYWQDDYYAVSVSESKLAEVRAYISNQEKHHKSVPFENEVRSFERVVAGRWG